MGRVLRIQIDLPTLRRNLSTADRREISTCEVRAWLTSAGFTPDHDAWIVREADLGHLQPDEVTSVDIEQQIGFDVKLRAGGLEPPKP